VLDRRYVAGGKPHDPATNPNLELRNPVKPNDHL